MAPRTITIVVIKDGYSMLWPLACSRGELLTSPESIPPAAGEGAVGPGGLSIRPGTDKVHRELVEKL